MAAPISYCCPKAAPAKRIATKYFIPGTVLLSLSYVHHDVPARKQVAPGKEISRPGTPENPGAVSYTMLGGRDYAIGQPPAGPALRPADDTQEPRLWRHGCHFHRGQRGPPAPAAVSATGTSGLHQGRLRHWAEPVHRIDRSGRVAEAQPHFEPRGGLFRMFGEFAGSAKCRAPGVRQRDGIAAAGARGSARARPELLARRRPAGWSAGGDPEPCAMAAALRGRPCHPGKTAGARRPELHDRGSDAGGFPDSR